MTSTAEKSRPRRVLLAMFAVVTAIGHFLRDVLGFFAESAETDSEKTSSDSVRGGVLNYRTGKLDDGTDAAGWYEKD
ncbi:MAG: hypothetical protein CMK46_07500 [Porticoccus sp.]|uniref:hypothetical protein n=1 Tax=Porticoccus hydrocarbonoclasticus TaxID=1073414 RepID=UPI000C3D1DD3|nr:hypothetical protein [Porticoccus hydrocarbonoclasticus]MBG58118.1 hypothetical protein [Porticoccus sp.]TNE82884.1 MAG: hypothetical protein EP334_01115 [Gammaproteobacteria bacterium]|tara:strand:- start:1044 stop:1274 length:231 start_codon:yes stop_codon:yes gene_type:complete